MVQRVCYLTLQDLNKDVRCLPSRWYLLVADEHCTTFAYIPDDSVKIHVVVHADLSASVKVIGMPAPHLTQNMEPIRVHSFLSNLSCQKFCEGITDPHLQKYSKRPSTESSQAHYLHTATICPEDKPCTKSCVRSSTCRLLTDNEMPECNQCTRVRPQLEKKEKLAKEREELPIHKNDPMSTTSNTKLKKNNKNSVKNNKSTTKATQKASGETFSAC